MPPEAALVASPEAASIATPDIASAPTILAIDTSAAHCAVVVMQEGRVLASRLEEMDKGQAERLMPLVAEALAKAGVTAGDLAAIGVGTGPGNFTGVRIAVAAARGLALALGVPAIGVTTFDAIALDGPRPMWVLLDARRGEVHAQRFEMSGPQTAFLARARDLALDGAPVAGSGIQPATDASLTPCWPMTEAIARIAALRLGSPQPRPAPFYLRGPDAAPPSDAPPVWLS